MKLPQPRFRRRADLLLLGFLLFFAATQGLSWLARGHRVHRYLTARLSATFGRPVEVGSFEVSLWRGPRLHANFITVGEDPRFGYEYFLLSDRLTASLRWAALLRGRLEFGTFSFARPSLNLVRSSEGHWNLESWLPAAPPAGASNGPTGLTQAKSPARLYRIQIETGRINFSSGVDRHPFALVDVTGNLEQEQPGHWRIDLEARLMCAAVVVQEAGTLRVRGRIGGAAARLSPADLELHWQEASLSDALRLFRGHDFGIRGRLALELRAQTGAPSGTSSAAEPFWSFSGGARLRDLHRWNIPQREGDPALNFSLDAQWWPKSTRLEWKNILVEGPRSNLHGSGLLQWRGSVTRSDSQQRNRSASTASPRSNFRFLSSGINLDDLLAWYRAFVPGVAAGTKLEGNAGLDLQVSGWPPRVERGVVVTDGARLRVAGLGQPVGVGRVVVRLSPARIELLPAGLTLPGPRASLRLSGAASTSSGPAKRWSFDLSLVGQSQRTQELLAAATALGWQPANGWSIEGASALRLRWQGTLFPFTVERTGSIDLRAAVLRATLLNRPIGLPNARVEFGAPALAGATWGAPSSVRISFSAAQAFGTRWSGWIASSGEPLSPSGTPAPRSAAPRWEFSLAADRLDVADLDRWLNPRWRQSLLERIVPFAGSRSDSAEAAEKAREDLRARGNLAVDHLVLAPVVLRRLRARAELQGRTPGELRLADAQAQFYGGTVRGSLRAEITSRPVYRVETQFERVDLAALAAATRTLAGRFAGTASGRLALSARGIGRGNLVRSLEGEGIFIIHGGQFRGLNLRESLVAGARRPGASDFRATAGKFSVASGKVKLAEVALADSAASYEVEGSVDFARVFDLRLRVLDATVADRTSVPRVRLPSGTFRVAGPLDALELARSEKPSRPD